MADFPSSQPVTPLFINSYSRYAAWTDIRGHLAANSPASISWPSANLAVYAPFVLPFPYPVRRVFWVNGSSAAANMDLGIYTPGGAKIYSTGSTAQSGASAPQFVTPTAFLLSPGRYYMALSCSGTTNAVFGFSTVDTTAGRFGGLLQEASAVPLPSSATFAAWASTGYPLFGITRTTTGF